MTIMKFESLPNEILRDIFEKYINGIDIITGFNYQLNQRMNGLINQCQRFRFNFIQCKKDVFRFCMGLLPAYMNKIEELDLSEQNTPGQTNAFLSFFPTFDLFPNLRKLHLQFDIESIPLPMIERALTSLSLTNIESLTINTMGTKSIFRTRNVLTKLLCLKFLKRFCFIGEFSIDNWNDLEKMTSNIEYLTLSSFVGEFHELEKLFQFAPKLKYLNLGINEQGIGYYRKKVARTEKKSILQMSRLSTLILYFQSYNRMTFDTLSAYLRSMPALNSLEIKGDERLTNPGAWQTLFETSLPLLNQFTLRTTLSCKDEISIKSALDSFQTSFWISKKNFNIIITDHESLHFNQSEIFDIQRNNTLEFDLPVVKYWIAPNRTHNNELTVINQISKLTLIEKNELSPSSYYFNNINFLAVDHMDKPLSTWLTTYVNCRKIKKFIIQCSLKSDELTLLLSRINNVDSLYIDFDLLMRNESVFMKTNNYLKSLNLSFNQHRFDENDIRNISKIFPYLEHMKINTNDLFNVQILNNYFPYLRSLTYEIPNNIQSFYDDYSGKKWEHELRKRSECLFQRKDSSITIWIDEAAYTDPLWEEFTGKTSNRNNRRFLWNASDDSSSSNENDEWE